MWGDALAVVLAALVFAVCWASARALMALLDNYRALRSVWRFPARPPKR